MSTLEVGKRIAALRDERGMTGEALGSLLGISKSEISKIENGGRKLDIGYIALIAEIFEISLGELLGTERHGSLAMAARVMSYPNGEEAQVPRQRIRQVLEADASLATSVGLSLNSPSPAGLAVMDRVKNEDLGAVADSREAGEALARIVREELGLGRAPLSDIAELAELHFGIDVLNWPTGTGISGLCVKGDGVALMLVSTSSPRGHQRFTAAHEIGHYLFSDPNAIIFEDDLFDKTTPLEMRANAFAESFLLPEDGLREVIGERAIDDGLIAELMRHFGVSYQGLIYRFRSTGILSGTIAKQWFSKSAGSVLSNANDQAPEELTKQTEEKRVPPRLWRAAEKGYKAGRVGLGILSMLGEEEGEMLFERLAGKGILPPEIEDDYSEITDILARSNA